MGYIKCPRCDLNYILEEEQYCNVCKADLKMGPKLLFANDDEDISEETKEKITEIFLRILVSFHKDWKFGKK